MDNLKDFTKAEFLYFLYAEKSREIENNSVPGWSKWAVSGTIVTIIIFLYHEITANYLTYDYEIFSRYTIISIAAAALFLLFCRYSSGVKSYMSEKVRPLKDEVSVLIYIFQFVLCLGATILQIYWFGFSLAFVFLTIAVLINVFILIYIFVNRDKFVLAQLKTQVFVNWKKDTFIHSFLGSLYGGTIGFSITDLLKKQQGFYFSEFEFAIGLLALIILIYWLLKISEKNNGVADEIDRLINKFVVGVISQEDAYKKYILIMYGFSAYQTIENDLEIIEDIKINYNDKTNIINDLEKRVQGNTISFDELQQIHQTLKAEINFYSKSMTSLSVLLDKFNNITNLGIPAAVDAEFNAVLEEYKNAYNLFSNLVAQTELIMKEIRNIIYCNKCGGICLDYECSHRNEPMSLKYTLRRKAWVFFKKIIHRISLNKKNKLLQFKLL